MSTPDEIDAICSKSQNKIDAYQISTKQLREHLKRFAELEEKMEEFQPIIKEHKKCLAKIKNALKERQKTCYKIEQPDLKRELIISFKVTKMSKVCIAIIPKTVKDQYMTECEVWRKNFIINNIEEREE